MSEKDRLVLAAILESIEKVRIFSGGLAGVDEFYADIKSFDAVLMNFVTLICTLKRSGRYSKTILSI